jgi:DNA-binding transcriptional ArsR family regulator
VLQCVVAEDPRLVRRAAAAAAGTAAAGAGTAPGVGARAGTANAPGADPAAGTGETQDCEVEAADDARVRRIQAAMTSETVMAALVELFRALGERSRTHILFALSQEPMCVHDLAESFGMSTSAASHQLRLLRSAGLVRYRKVGRQVFYSLADQHILDLFRTALEHVQE